MTADWENAKEIFAEALDLPEEERDGFVATICKDNPETADLVRQLLQADSEAGNFLDPTWLATAFAMPASIQPGDTICGRYRILRLIAEGGMGHVYEAHDQELNVRIALKTIHPEIASTPGALARFRQEVRIAIRITHPNVCRTFHMDRETRRDPASDAVTDELLFLTMEYLEGESLAQRLRKRGRLSLEETLVLARQMAGALDAAHALGVVHRDIKPANIMLVPPATEAAEHERAVITDFGLARIDAIIAGEMSSISAVGAAMGTLAYMAPEQIQGEATTPATDIYAFGLVLFEMVTGGKAFPGSASVMSAVRRVNQPAPSAREFFPELPQHWEVAIRACLQTAPQDRPACAMDVIRSLQGDLNLRRRIWRRRILRRPAGIGLALGTAAVAALFALGLRYWVHTADSHVATGTLVYVAPAANKTGEAELKNVTQLIDAGLTQSGQVNLLDDSRVGDLLQQMTRPPDTPITAPIAREIAMRAGANRTILPEITRTSTGYQLTVDIQQPDNTPARYRNHWTKSWTWQSTNSTSAEIPPGLLLAVRECSNWVRSQLGESASDIARLDAPPEDVTTSNWQALDEYASAEHFNDEHRRDEALLALQNAVQLDPQFALAYARMGDILNSVDRSLEGDEAYAKALQTDSQRRLTRRERDRIRGIYANDTWDYQTAESVFRDETIYYEQDYLGWFYRGSALIYLDRTSEAVHDLNEAAELRPTGTSSQFALAAALLIVGDQQKAEYWRQKLVVDKHPDVGAWVASIQDRVRGNFDAAAKSLADMENSKDPFLHSWSFSLLGDLAADRGDYKSAAAFLTEGMAFDEANGSRAEHAKKQMERASMECKQRQYDVCLTDIRAALSESSDFMMARFATEILAVASSESPIAVKPKLREAMIAVRSNLPKGDYGNRSTIVRLQVEAEIDLCEGRTNLALEQLRKVAILDAPAEPKLYLAQALLQASRTQPDLRQSEQFRDEAEALYAAAAQKPAYLAYRFWGHLPGIYGDALAAWLSVALTKDSPVELAPQLAQYAALRPAAFQRDLRLSHALQRSNSQANPKP